MNQTPSSTPPDIEKASELLDVTNEAELEAVLDRLVAGTARQAGRRISADGTRALTTALKQTARQTLPTLACVTDPGTPPTTAGRSPVATAAHVYGLELEGLSAEDRDYEIAQQFVRFAEAAARRAVTSPSGRPPSAAVGAAIADAARELAPGLQPLRPTDAGGPRSGRWVRRGHTIILTGLEPDPV